MVLKLMKIITQISFLLKPAISLLVIVLLVSSTTELFSQEQKKEKQQEQDTTKSTLSSDGPAEDFELDTIVKQEASPLDISKNRGLFITASDGKMQLRILGSVRFSTMYDMIDMPIKNTFNTYYIPTGSDNKKIPNYFNSLNQTRLGFEVTRKLENTKVFVRLETDFNGPNGKYRIRHAYGQIGNLLVGQTWSLFSNVSSLPPTVDGNGPTGSVTLRTPQIRYRGKKFKGITWSVALEYSQPDLNPQEADTLNLETVQMIPDFTGRIQREGLLGDVQLSLIATTITTKDINSKISNSFGLGTSLSGTINITKKHKILYQATWGRSIAHFITTFTGTGQDAAFNPITNKFESLTSYSGFVSYGFNWKKDISTNLSIGSANQVNKSFQSNDAFKNSMSFSVDTFWRVIEGARVGLEYVYGQRWDKDGTTGAASRVWALFYYDF
jgi:hypothetical protein